MKIIFVFAVVCLLFFACKNQISPEVSAARSDVDVATAKKMIAADPSIVILDVRTPQETNAGIIPNAIKIDYRSSTFDAQIEQLDKTKTYIVYCKSGGRSSGACNKMANAGFTNIINMKGGYSSWD